MKESINIIRRIIGTIVAGFILGAVGSVVLVTAIPVLLGAALVLILALFGIALMFLAMITLLPGKDIKEIFDLNKD